VYASADDVRSYAPMPAVSGLCLSGVLFRRVWSSPTCSPTRAGLLTGRYGFRYGIGSPVDGAVHLPLDEVTLPEVLAATDRSIAMANIGKWHLGVLDEIGGLEAPAVHGWPHYAGLIGGTLEAYDRWSRTEGGVTEIVTDYATSRSVDDAILWLGEQDSEQPWLLWLAFSAPHTPFHVPPAGLHSYVELSTDEDAILDDPSQHYQASLEALDTELTRLLRWIEHHGHGPVDVIVMGDNGTPRQVIDEAHGPTRAKGSIYEGGVNVPFCVSGPSVVDGGRESDALVQTLDVFATIADLFGADLEVAAPGVTLDAISFAGILDDSVTQTRSWAYTESFSGDPLANIRDATAIRDYRHKLIRVDVDGDGVRELEELYDLTADPFEDSNLLDGVLTNQQQHAYDSLLLQLGAIP
jgi:arylsulfatase B